MERIIKEGMDLLWSQRGERAIRWLREQRYLKDDTIRTARIGLQPRDQEFRIGDRPIKAWRGLIIPWMGMAGPTYLNVRRPIGQKPKYMGIGERKQAGVYPSDEVIRPGRPLVIVEGEFDALVLGQDLGERASVITLGGAGCHPHHNTLAILLSVHPWFIATDGDDAGIMAAEWWLSRYPCRRVCPPQGKDWTEAKSMGVNLSEFWSPLLSGASSPC